MKYKSIFGLLAALTATLLLSINSVSQAKDVELSLDSLITVQPILESYLKARQKQTKELAVKYGKVLDSHLNKEADAGFLKVATAFKGEKESLADLEQGIDQELKDPVLAVQKGIDLPELGSGTPEALVSLRKIWTTEMQKIRAKLDRGLQQSLKKLETDWTKARDFKNAQEVLALRESLLSNSPVAVVNVADSKRAPTTKEPAKKSKSAMRRDLEKKLVGTKWKDSGGWIYQFEKRGQASVTKPGNAAAQNWKWEVEEPGKVRFIYSSANSIVFIFGEEGEDVIKEWYGGDGGKELLSTSEVEEVK